ncbi:hypothetical protein EVA_13227 [gut metagenome]|uniref:Uncharacterized protein n=1 Tax=gut metagenome TaxID=749906 RepID=J9FUL9_9ZZZZ
MLKFLNVNGTFLLKSFSYRRFVKLLSASQLFYDTSFFKFSFEFLQRFFNVFAFFYRNYNHFFVFKLLMVK